MSLNIKEVKDKLVGKMFCFGESYVLCLNAKKNKKYIVLMLLFNTGEVNRFHLLPQTDYISNDRVYNMLNDILIEAII